MIYLYGASGHAKVIVDVLTSVDKHVTGVFDDNIEITNFLNLDYLGVFNNKKINAKAKLILSIGDNRVRKLIANRINVNYFTAIHKNTTVSFLSNVDFGTVVMGNAVINANTNIGKHCIINTSAVIEHDCKLADFVHVSPNATITGNVTIGEGTHVGAGAVVIPNIKIGKWATIGAGAVVTKDIPDYAVVVGNPAQTIKYNIK